MANFHVIAGASETPEFPIVRRIGPADLKDALRKGFDDFWAMPSQVFFIGLIYPIAGVILAGSPLARTCCRCFSARIRLCAGRSPRINRPL